tara:strand:+ start:93 stop:767 length:675 start_codon:yes stop_codon:yes gene_type:complete
MGLPVTGPLSIYNIRAEVGGSTTGVSLNSLSATAGFSTPPYEISDFYGYTTPGLTGVLDTETLTSSTSWSQYTLNLVNYGDAKLVIAYTSGTSYTGDIQIGGPIVCGSTTFNPNNTTPTWQTSRSGETTYSSVVWNTVLDGATSLRWNRRNTAPSSGGTGLAPVSPVNYFYYAETSSPGYSNRLFWLRSPTFNINSSNKTLSFYLANYGATVNNFKVYLDMQQM